MGSILRVAPRAKSREFVGFQVPFTDLRTIGNGPPRLARPSWPDPRTGADFVRGLAAVRDRPRGSIAGWVGESSYCPAGRLLRIPARSTTSDGFDVSTVYVRLFGTEYTYRLDAGFVVRGRSPLGPSTVNAIYAMDVSTEDFHGPLSDAGRPLARTIERRTQEHATGSPGPRGSRVAPGRPLCLVERLSDRSSGAVIHGGFIGSRKSRTPLYVLECPVSMPSSHRRQIRGTLWRVHSELELLREVNRYWRGFPEDVDPLRLRGLLAQVTGRLSRRRRGGLDQPSLLSLAEELEGFDRTELNELADSVREMSKGVARQIDLVLERSRAAAGDDRAMIHVERIGVERLFMGDESNFQFNAPASGIFGSRNKSEGDRFVAVGPASPLWEKLERELERASGSIEPERGEVLEKYQRELGAANDDSRPGILARLRDQIRTWGPVVAPLLAILNQILKAGQ